MNTPKVSVLIPVYNRQNLIETTVKSALDQTYQNTEIVIVDNKSTDNTWKILQALAQTDDRVKIYQNETNIGPVRNWLRCINEATGEYAKILWSDDLIDPTFLEKTVPFLEDKEVGFAFTSAKIFKVNITEPHKISLYRIGKTGLYPTEKYIQSIIDDKDYPVSPACALFRLNDLKNNTLADIPNKVASDFAMHAIGNDLLMFLLTANQYQKFAFVNEPLSYFRAHNDSITIASNREKLYLYYALAGVYFVENHRPDLIIRMNTKIWFLLKKYKTQAKKYNMYHILDFYMNNKNQKIDISFIAKKIFRKILSYVK